MGVNLAPERAAIKLGVYGGGRREQRGEPFAFRVGQAQALGRGLCDSFVWEERRQATQGIGRRCRFDLLQAAQNLRIFRARQYFGEHAHLRHNIDHRRRVGRGQQFEHFIAETLARELAQRLCPGGSGGKAGAVGRACAVPGVEAEETQQAEMVFGDALAGIANETNTAGLNVLHAVPGIVDIALGRARQRVHGEIATRRVGLPVIGKRNIGMAAMALHIHSECGDLKMLPVDHGGYGAVRQTGRNILNPGLFEKRHDGFGYVRRGNVDIANGNVEQGIAHATADESYLLSSAAKRVDNGAR